MKNMAGQAAHRGSLDAPHSVDRRHRPAMSCTGSMFINPCSAIEALSRNACAASVRVSRCEVLCGFAYHLRDLNIEMLTKY